MVILWVIVLFAGYLVLVAIGTWYGARRHSAQVIAWLTEQGATDIAIEQIFDHGRYGALVYRAEYADRNGQRRHAVCQVVMGTVQWSDAVEVVPSATDDADLEEPNA